MDIQKALNELYEEKKRLDWTISTLEARLQNNPSPVQNRRGRKSMGGDERLEVSKRMSAYWADRRAAKRAAQATGLQLPLGPEHEPQRESTAFEESQPSPQGPQSQQLDDTRNTRLSA